MSPLPSSTFHLLSFNLSYIFHLYSSVLPSRYSTFPHPMSINQIPMSPPSGLLSLLPPFPQLQPLYTPLSSSCPPPTPLSIVYYTILPFAPFTPPWSLLSYLLLSLNFLYTSPFLLNIPIIHPPRLPFRGPPLCLNSFCCSVQCYQVALLPVLEGRSYFDAVIQVARTPLN